MKGDTLQNDPFLFISFHMIQLSFIYSFIYLFSSTTIEESIYIQHQTIQIYIQIHILAVHEEGAGGEPMGRTYTLFMFMFMFMFRVSAQVAEARSDAATAYSHTHTHESHMQEGPRVGGGEGGGRHAGGGGATHRQRCTHRWTVRRMGMG